ncbi:hypothetical protein GCM10007358_12440 [Phocicoccus schoeneichii]|uniref:DUF262 domain-containing protein n=1 Tax=Phocicoccus schoeneichii TaxID=1812261 RepID=A0A6V7R9B3_9BACL|nr:DUF262 domain-containing protein [Jeotgalicoccus schoeneichii]GGH53261.1 hypothetical protein GCM10007358_12440 [Jeotgalicoccus schoeneichii]CAD2073866.1 hypothetical protein JEOSCH030_00575 [Jeotgalicoccus schoeneichii]
MAIIDSNFKSLKKYFADAPYHVPEYQRGYSWDKEQLDDLWQDFIHLQEEEKLEKHFLGQVVIHNDTKEDIRNIIDGQQRTSTSIIVLDAFRRKFYELSSEQNTESLNNKIRDVIEEIIDDFIGKETSRKDSTKLFLGEADKKFFRIYIQEPIVSKIKVTKSSLSNSEKRIFEASNFFLAKLEEQIEGLSSNEEKYNKLDKLYESFINSMQVMYVETNNLNEAFIIFETLNARGKSLETSDLLKNLIFSKSGDQIGENKNDWNRMLDQLGNSDATKYIRSYWNAKKKFVRNSGLYKVIRAEINSQKAANDLVSDLAKYASLYSAIDRPTESTYYRNPKINEKLNDINDLNAKTYYPIMLALELKDAKEDDVLRVLDAIETLIVRNFVVSGKTANSYEVKFSKIAQEFYNGQISSIQEILEELRKEILSDSEFRNNFETFSIKQKPAVRYLYRKIANHNEKEIQVIRDNNKVHIEHIMPEKKGAWEISEEVHAEYVNRFGNLTLLGDEYNRSASNLSFDRKKEIYKKSKIGITYELSKQSNWTINDIANRQEYLTDTALEIWKK